MIVVNYKGKSFSLKDVSKEKLAELMKDKEFRKMLGVK